MYESKRQRNITTAVKGKTSNRGSHCRFEGSLFVLYGVFAAVTKTSARRVVSGPGPAAFDKYVKLWLLGAQRRRKGGKGTATSNCPNRVEREEGGTGKGDGVQRWSGHP